MMDELGSALEEPAEQRMPIGDDHLDLAAKHDELATHGSLENETIWIHPQSRSRNVQPAFAKLAEVRRNMFITGHASQFIRSP